jgi:hypothetical protein
VIVLDRCDVVGLTTTPDGRRATGARVLRRADSSAEELLDADLVVDATGRGSPTPVWLEALGYPRPPTEQVRIGLGYATRTYRLPADALDGDLAVLQAATPQHPRAGALQVLEGDRWMVTLAGMLGDHPPTDPDGFLGRWPPAANFQGACPVPCEREPSGPRSCAAEPSVHRSAAPRPCGFPLGGG